MRTPRLFHPAPLKGLEKTTLTPGAAKHVLTVLRLKPGAKLVLFDGSGFEYGAVLDRVEKKEARVKIVGMHGPAVESPLKVILAQGVSRGERMDYTVQKAVELGVAEIVPVLTERSVVKLNPESAEKKRQHWQSVVIGACEQSGRVRVPDVRSPLPFASFLEGSRNVLMKLLLDPAANATPSHLSPPSDKQVLLLVGPEGGLSEAERGLALRAGFHGVRLGPRVLRTETAALVVLSLLQSQWGDLS